ncbi:hypothetical protein [Devosia sp.]|uniref:hypothetical protein n=1 Tax=Devosia sp. TaxID=1871048 RepID=UPI003266905D
MIERRAAAIGLVQSPNARSSHTRPTPSGGGAAIAVAGALVGLYLSLSGGWVLLAITVVAAGIALLGFLDDLFDLSPAIRFPVQAVLVAVLVVTASPLPGIALPFSLTLGGFALGVLVVLAGIWWINLFNFMDGIDGIAASQAIIILLGAAALWLAQDSTALALPLLVLLFAVVAAAFGFMVRNWPPAKIFMGDAGSNFLAMVILAVAALTIANGALGYAGWIILVSVFLVDATVTLVRRLSRGERPWIAHRRHAYQQLSRRFGHRNITLLYAGLSLLWALPLAWCAQARPDLQWWLVIICIVPLAGFTLWAGGGAATE